MHHSPDGSHRSILTPAPRRRAENLAGMATARRRTRRRRSRPSPDRPGWGPPGSSGPRGSWRRRPRPGGAPRWCRARCGRSPGSSAASSQDRADHLGEVVQALLGLGLGGLDHERLVHQQREVHGGRVDLVVEHPLGDVQRLDAQLLLGARAREHELVHAVAVEGDRQVLADAVVGQQRLEVVGVQHRQSRRPPSGPRRPASRCRRRSARTRRSCPGSRASCRSTWAGRGRARSAARRRCSDSSRTTCGRGRNGSIRSEHGDRAGARAAAAVRLGEGLVQVVVHDVEAHVAGARDAHDGVQVGPVVVEGAAHARARSRRSPRCCGRTAPACWGW